MSVLVSFVIYCMDDSSKLKCDCLFSHFIEYVAIESFHSGESDVLTVQ